MSGRRRPKPQPVTVYKRDGTVEVRDPDAFRSRPKQDTLRAALRRLSQAHYAHARAIEAGNTPDPDRIARLEREVERLLR